MRCSACGRENPSGSRFCLECGTVLALRCPQCDAEIPSGAKFCNQCGVHVAGSGPGSEERAPRAYTPTHLAEKILTTRAALEGERRQVTVLYADMAGFTGFAERLDPEEVHRIITDAFEHITAGIHRFEGTINQYTGDGLMAGRFDEAARTLDASVKLAESLATPREIWMGRAALAKVLGHLGREREAEAELAGAAKTIEAIASRLTTPRLRQSFLGAEPVTEVFRTLGRHPPDGLG